MEDPRNTQAFQRKSYQQAKHMADNTFGGPKHAQPQHQFQHQSRKYNDYQQQKQFFRKEGPTNFKRTTFKPQGEVDAFSPDFALMNIFES